MANNEYLKMRGLARQNSATMGMDHPCRRGVAHCCADPGVLITPADGDYILEGFRNGEFNPALRAQAIENARRSQQGRRKLCPFLDDRRQCTIYKRRPMICVATGAFGLPGSIDAANRLDVLPESSMKIGKLGTSMCQQCHNQLVEEGKSYPPAVLKNSQTLYRYMDRVGMIGMAEFVLKALAKLHLK